MAKPDFEDLKKPIKGIDNVGFKKLEVNLSSYVKLTVTRFTQVKIQVQGYGV